MSVDGTISIHINGEHRRVRDGLTLAELASELGFVPEKVAVERNLEVVPRSTLAQVMVEDGDELEIVHFVGGGDVASVADDSWSVAGQTFRSRLIVGTGKYKNFEQNAAAVAASGAEIVTVAVRRVNVSDPKAPMLTDYIDPKVITYLPKTLRATEILAKEGFKPMVYCVDDPIAAKRLEDVGAVAIMPLGAPIGSGLGIQNRVTIRLIVEGTKLPVLVDAGVGTASEAAQAMELGCTGVLMNTAIAEAKDPVLMAAAMKAGVEAGRMAYRAGRMGKRMYADPSSPLAGLI